MCFNYRRPFFLLPSRIYKWSVQASIVKHKKQKNFTRRQYHQHAIDKKRFNPRKTVSRKLEEILLVYILENNRIVKRMLEVYFNIIEWGPNVWNRRRAVSTQKSPSELTFNECLFLARIIPSQENSCSN
jgi:hypothetical protein